MMAVTSVTAQGPYASRQRKNNQSLEKSTPEQKKPNTTPISSGWV